MSHRGVNKNALMPSSYVCLSYMYRSDLTTALMCKKYAHYNRYMKVAINCSLSEKSGVEI